MKNRAEELLRERLIRPTEESRSSYIGIEVEMPVVNLTGGKTDKNAAVAAFNAAVERFGFTGKKFDSESICHEAVCGETGDVFSFDCSYNNFEISLGKVRTLHEAQARFRDYTDFINAELRKSRHLLTGMGVNPHYRVNDLNFVPSPRYKMLEGFLRKSRDWEREGGFHGYCGFPTFSSASQVQLDVSAETLCGTIEAFSLAEPLKALLFANSYLPDEPSLLCARDMLWERSTHGINPRNLGFFEPLPQTVDELVSYLAGASIFCAERDEKYLYFRPIPFEEYLTKAYVDGEYFDGERYAPYRFTPQESDIAVFRTYKQIDLTARGTLEFRSACTQPLHEAMTVAAFHLGLMSKTAELSALLKQDDVLYHHGYSPAQLRAMMNRRTLPDFVDKARLRELLLSVLLLAQQGLDERGFSENVYLHPLFERASTLTSPAKKMIGLLDSGTDLLSIIEAYTGGQVTAC